jgi:DNA-binding GntR family transcriptional regulator
VKETEAQSKPSLKLQAYQYLKNKILQCEYAPNEFLNEQKLCEEMGNISRTPMRDALGRLEQEGLITILPKKGLMVSSFSEEDVHSIFEVRHLVEPYALRNYGYLLPRKELLEFHDAMMNPEQIEDFCGMDDAFHALVVSVLPNRYLCAAHEAITAQNTRFRILTGRVGLIDRAETSAEHIAVLNAALAGDWNAAGDAMDKHLVLSHERANHVFERLSVGA